MAQIIKIKNEQREIMPPQEYQEWWDHYQQLYVNKMDNLEEIDKFNTISQDWSRKK